MPTSGLSRTASRSPFLTICPSSDVDLADDARGPGADLDAAVGVRLDPAGDADLGRACATTRAGSVAIPAVLNFPSGRVTVVAVTGGASAAWAGVSTRRRVHERPGKTRKSNRLASKSPATSPRPTQGKTASA